MEAIEPYLLALAEGDATALHLRAKDRPFWRVEGELIPNGDPLPAGGAFDAMLDELTRLGRVDAWARDRDTEFVAASGGARFLVRLSRTSDGPSALLVRLTDPGPDAERLRIPEPAVRSVLGPPGLVLVMSGRDGGKSSSLAALLSSAACKSQRYILALQAPASLAIESGRSVVHAFQVGHDVPSHAAGVAMAIGLGADVIGIDELADAECASLALEAADGGACVVAAMHAHSLISGLDRFVALLRGPSERRLRGMLAQALRFAMHQTLVPSKQGRLVPAAEWLCGVRVANDMLRAGKEAEIPALFHGARVAGLRSFDDSLEELVRSHDLDRDEALRRAQNRSRFEQKTAGASA